MIQLPSVNSFKNVAVLTVVVFWSISLGSTFKQNLDDPNVPCKFLDTVNLTGHTPYPNGSYSYEGALIPKELVGVYNYEIRFLEEKVKVPPHVRGCICLLRKCIKKCCGPDTNKYVNKTCNEIYPRNNTIDITPLNGSAASNVIIGNVFALQEGRPCKSMYALMPSDDNHYAIFENGTLFRGFDSAYINKDDYCLSSVQTDEDDPKRILVPLLCSDQSHDDTILLYSYAMIFSVPFMLITAAVYLGIPKLRNIHGKSLACYLITLSFGYAILVVFNRGISLSDTLCKVLGFSAYFLIMSSFFWLSVISFDLWWNFKRPNRVNEKKWFNLYSLYAWGIAALFLVFTISAQQTDIISPNWKPHIGSEQLCWLNVKVGWSAMLYFFGPIMIIILANVVFFILTSLEIHSLRKEIEKPTASENSAKKLRKAKDSFGLYLRLFIVMGITWTMEIISYMVGDNSDWSKWFVVTDIWNALQGFIIFVLFVLRKKIIRLIKKFKGRNDPEDEATNSSNSTFANNLRLVPHQPSADKPLINRTLI